MVKANQPTLYHEIADAFSVLPPLNCHEAEFWAYERVESAVRAHGRLERCTLESTTALTDYLTWPHVAQVLRRTCWRQERRSGRICQQVHFGITSLSRTEVTLAQLEQLWRNHWTIENALHYVRDVALGEDGCRVRTGSAPQALAALRNALVSLLRHEGWSFVPNALRHFDHHLQDALRLIGAFAT